MRRCLSTALCVTEDPKGGKWPLALETNWLVREHTAEHTCESSLGFYIELCSFSVWKGEPGQQLIQLENNGAVLAETNAQI